jgi:RNA polymerase sigma factor (sigma-70 family)
MEINGAALYRTVAKRFTHAAPDELDDAVSASLVAIWEAREAGVELHRPEAYATTVARRAVGAQIRWRSKNVYPDSDERLDWKMLQLENGVLVEHPDHGAGVDALRVVAEAPTVYADVLRRHYLEGMDFSQIAEIDSVTTACVRKRHERALKWARQHFHEESSR